MYSGFREKQKTRWDEPNGFFVLATSYSRTAYRRTTIGAAAFHCRVRNGNGWDHCAIITRNLPRRSGTNFWRIEDFRLSIADLMGPTVIDRRYSLSCKIDISISKNRISNLDLKSAIYNCRFLGIYIQSV